MRIFVDADKFVSKQEMHSALRAVLGEENYFGSNLDALHDCLTSIGEPTELVITNWGCASRHLGKYADILWHVLDDSANENGRLRIILN